MKLGVLATMDKRCQHCSGIVIGHATVYFDDKSYPVCHPNTGLDCYKLVTIYNHTRWCFPCTDVRLVLDAQFKLNVSQ
jgi:hypothetical protein